MNTPDSQPLGQTQSQTQSEGPDALEYCSLTSLLELDEACTQDGQVKPQWSYLLNSLRDLGPTVLNEREQKARRILRDDGATYNIYGRDNNPSSNWELDPVPYIIDSEDWGKIEAGLLERSELFNLMLRDLYGPRTLLRHGVLPPEALFSNGGFLRACQGIQLPGEHELILHAVDMVHRLASFYQRLRLKLASLSPSEEEPLVVVLTPGGQNETYFEHAHLANYLGFPLVQSGDLLVRNGFLWMKSLDGLKRVDVVFRRVDDMFCDPVELRSDSLLGVPGLLEVARTGQVVIANPLGSGVLENPTLLKYLPLISKHLLGRELRLESVKTYWCGDEKDLQFVTANIRQLIIKPTYRGSGIKSVWGGDLSDEQVNQLLATLHKKKHQYVAQERLEKSYTPAFSEGKLEPRPTLLRTFSVATDKSYMVLPGGLTRIGTHPHGREIKMQTGSPSKDTWITATEPERTVVFETTPEVTRAVKDSPLLSLPSRVAENLYWMGRYAERAEASLRLLRTVFVLLNGEEPISLNARRVLLQTVTQITDTLPGFMNASDELLACPEEELLLVIIDDNRAGSIKSTLNAMLSSADESKELLSTDTIRVINDLRDALDDLDFTLEGGLTSAPEEALDPLVTGLAALSGLMQESMIRGVGWRFMELGKRIERSRQIINSLRSLMIPVTEEGTQSTLLTALLLSMEVMITYRRRGRVRRGIELGLELVMLDDNNPRSLLFQLERLQQILIKLPQPEERVLLEATTSLKLSRLSQLLETTSGKRGDMDTLLLQLDRLLDDFNRFISDKHFDQRTDTQQLVTTFWGGL